MNCSRWDTAAFIVGELAKRMAEVSPGRLKKSFFGNSGAEAIEGAMRLSKHHTGKNEILALIRDLMDRNEVGVTSAHEELV